MALILRLDIDRPYGRKPLHRHLLSRLSSDLYFPGIECLGYLKELETMLQALNEKGARAYVFFRRCTRPSRRVMKLLAEGNHEIGLHLEDSRSFATFSEEKAILERHIGKPVLAVSKHGSGGAKYGYHHYAPYEPDRYVSWAEQAGMRLFLGNLEDPTLEGAGGNGFRAFPSAFWLEPHWRDTARFTTDWLQAYAKDHDVVLLVHPENVIDDPSLSGALSSLLGDLETRILP